MKNKSIFLILSSVIITLIMLSLVSSFMPKFTHRYIWEQSLSKNLPGNLYGDCVGYKGFCYAGTVLDDVTVITYYTDKGLYGLTHSPQFCSAMLNNVAKVPGADYSDPETIKKYRAVAIGSCMHEPADISSHSRQNKDGTGEDGMVAYAIKHSLIVNAVIHVMAEQKLDLELEKKYPDLDSATKKDLEENYIFAQPLFVISMMGLDSNLDKAYLDKLFQRFKDETLNYQGYRPAYSEKSFFGTLEVIPLSYLIIYFIVMAGFAFIIILLTLKIFKKQGKIRHWVGLFFFVPLLIIMIYLAYSALQGNAFNNFLGIINPLTKFVPIGNSQTYIDNAISNTKGLLSQGEGWLDNTDASGMGQIPVLIEADAQILIYDYIILAGIFVFFTWFIWFILKKNKVIKRNGGVSFNL